LLKLLAELDKHLDELDTAASHAAEEHPQAKLPMTQPGVGPITSLAYVMTIGDASRFKRGNQAAGYLHPSDEDRSPGTPAGCCGRTSVIQRSPLSRATRRCLLRHSTRAQPQNKRPNCPVHQ
jgi:hypothetical protein